MTEGGQLGSIQVTSSATVPPAKIKWLELVRWWNPLCSNLLHAAPSNNRIGEYNQSLAFYDLVAGSCTVCITPILVADIFLRPIQVTSATNVTAAGTHSLTRTIGTSDYRDWTYAWTKPDTVVTFAVALSSGSLVSGVSYTATWSFRVSMCGDDGVLKTPSDASEPVTVTARLLNGVTEVVSVTVQASAAWVTHSVTLDAMQFAALGALSSLRMEFVTSASGGDATSRTGVAISWAEVAIVVQE